MKPKISGPAFFSLILFLATSAGAQAQRDRMQKENIPMDPKYWQYDSTRTEFIQHRGVAAVCGKGGKSLDVFLKDKSFSNGTIEFDIELTGRGFPGINFRTSEDRKNSENFYIRCFGDFNPLTRTTLQYAAVIDGLSMWDLTDEYQAGASLDSSGWNHVKLVISGSQMKAYVNDMQHPALLVPQLESGRNSGAISLSGNVVFANLSLKAGATEGLDPNPGYDPTYNDPRYLRKWQYSEPVNFPVGREPVIQVPSAFMNSVHPDIPDSNSQWKPVLAGPRAMVNLSRLFGAGGKGNERRICWLKTTIHADSAQDRYISFGFSDEVWMLINDQLLYVDKNCFGTPNQKEPKGRATIDNTRILVPLKKGDNDLLIGLTNYFYGWGIVARLDASEGLKY